MRLIDSDNIKEKILAYWGCDPSYYEGVEADRDTYLLSRLEITPTVEAIPIEWIKDYANELISLEERNYFAYRGIGDYGKGLLELIEKWRENGKKAMRDEVD